MPTPSNSVLHVLMHIFKNHMNGNGEACATESQILDELTTAGFAKQQVTYALDWLKGLIRLKDTFHPCHHTGKNLSQRIYNQQELNQLNRACRGLISRLEQAKILNPCAREIVIDRLIALRTEGIDLSLVKWVSLMVLFNQGNEQNALDFMEYIALNETQDGLQ